MVYGLVYIDALPLWMYILDLELGAVYPWLILYAKVSMPGLATKARVQRFTQVLRHSFLVLTTIFVVAWSSRSRLSAKRIAQHNSVLLALPSIVVMPHVLRVSQSRGYWRP